MKRALLIAVAVLFVVGMAQMPVFAETSSEKIATDEGHVHEVHDKTVLEGQAEKPLNEWVLGAKADAPKLVQLTENLFLGAEVSKDLRYTSADEGWAAYAKVTYVGCLLFCK